MSYLIIDAHMHLWEQQNGLIEGLPVRSLRNGRSSFLGETRQMMPPYMVDGRNTAEMFVANMDYAQVAAAVVTQEYLDGEQNEYLLRAKRQYGGRIKICGMAEFRRPGYLKQAENLIASGVDGIKVPAQRLASLNPRVYLTEPKMMQVFEQMEEKGIFLSIDLADGEEQVAEMQEIIRAFPRLRIAIGHFGMVTRDGWEKQIDLAIHPHVRIETGGITWLFHHEFYPYPGAVRAIRQAIGQVGVEKLMWGSDYPRTMTDITYKMSYDFLIHSEAFSQNEIERFLGLNALEFYAFSGLTIPDRVRNMLED